MEGKVYKVTSENTINIYVGSTTQSLKRRFQKHVSKFNTKETNGQPLDVYEILKFGKCQIELLESIICETQTELFERERYYIETLNNVINKRIPLRTVKEWRETNKAQIKIRRNVIIDCECGLTYPLLRKARHQNTWKHQRHLAKIQNI